MFNWSENLTFPKITDAINVSDTPPNILHLFTYPWIAFFGAWFFAALIGFFGIALYMKYEDIMVTIVYYIVMILLLGGSSGILFKSYEGLPSANFFVYIVGIIAAFAIGSLLYVLFIKEN